MILCNMGPILGDKCSLLIAIFLKKTRKFHSHAQCVTRYLSQVRGITSHQRTTAFLDINTSLFFKVKGIKNIPEQQIVGTFVTISSLLIFYINQVYLISSL